MEMRKMTDLERRALLGDKQAQEECTEKGIVLSCPFCGGTIKRKIGFAGLNFFKCQKCGAVISFDNDYYNSHKNEAVEAFNTRFAPQIGRCGECKHSWNQDEYGYINCTNLHVIMKQDDFCSLFEHKETKLNEKF